MRVKKLPMILALHLKRFKYMEQYNRHIKVSHRVVFPLELRLFNTVICIEITISWNDFEFFFSFQSDDAVNPDRLYDLMAVVIHCGSGPNRGHYISIVKSHGFWLLFDDDMVDVRITFIRSTFYTTLVFDLNFLFFYRKLKRQQLKIFMEIVSRLIFKNRRKQVIYCSISPVIVLLRIYPIVRY